MNELENIDNINIDELYNRIVVLIENAKRNVAVKINNEMTFLYEVTHKSWTVFYATCSKSILY